MSECKDRVLGTLLGLAAGDRIGGPVRMALRVAESLHDQGRFDALDIGRRYLEWWREGAFDTGPTTAQVLSLVASGASFEQALICVDERLGEMTAGCNPAHRIAPLAMYRSLDDVALASAAIAEARLTHRHPIAGEIAAVVASLCRALIRGVSWTNALEVCVVGRGLEARCAVAIPRVGELSLGGFAPEVLRSAIYFLNDADSLSAALARSIEFAGPENYCPVLVGSIGGARWGCSQIAAEALWHHGDLVPRLTSAGIALAREW